MSEPIKRTPHTFGQWAGNPKGVREDPERCIAEVCQSHISDQCQRKRGFGPGGLYCKQHGKKREVQS